VAEPDLVKTGIAGFDAILGGGFPRGNVVVVEGPAGSGKTTIGLEFIYHGATRFDEPGVIVLFEVSPSKIVRDAAQLGLDLPALEQQGKLKIIFTTRSVLQQELQQADSLLLSEAAGDRGAPDLHRLAAAAVAGRIERAPRRDRQRARSVPLARPGAAPREPDGDAGG
jgi:KaiC/GvpD/RAD55 family RecA-like ATPase